MCSAPERAGPPGGQIAAGISSPSSSTPIQLFKHKGKHFHLLNWNATAALPATMLDYTAPLFSIASEQQYFPPGLFWHWEPGNVWEAEPGGAVLDLVIRSACDLGQAMCKMGTPRKARAL